MILESLVNVLTAMVDFIIGLIPSTEPPGWMTDGGTYLTEIVGMASGLGAWVPWGLAGNVFGAVMTCVGVGLTIKLVRIVASFFTAGGGSAA